SPVPNTDRSSWREPAAERIDFAQATASRHRPSTSMVEAERSASINATIAGRSCRGPADGKQPVNETKRPILVGHQSCLAMLTRRRDSLSTLLMLVLIPS